MNSPVLLSESLVISLFSMIIVFVGLVIISALISALKLLEKKEPAVKVNESKPAPSAQAIPAQAAGESDGISKETIAILAAAIAMYQQVGVEEFHIKNIRRVNDTNPWQQMGITERLINKI